LQLFNLFFVVTLCNLEHQVLFLESMLVLLSEPAHTLLVELKLGALIKTLVLHVAVNHCHQVEVAQRQNLVDGKLIVLLALILTSWGLFSSFGRPHFEGW